MFEPARSSKSAAVPAPPPLPPPLPPKAPSVFQRLVARTPIAFGLTLRQTQGHGIQDSETRLHHDATRTSPFAPLPAQTLAHKTGIPIAAVDISPYKTHAILAGKEILKTVQVADRRITEDLNLKSAVTLYASTHESLEGGASTSKRRDFLSATDVKWSHGSCDHIIAAAANNGRLTVYDISRPEVELLWLHEHTRQVHKLGFNPHQGALFLSGSHDGTVKYWDLRACHRGKSSLTLKSTKHFPGRGEAVRDLRWSPTDGVQFITCTDAGTIFKWDSRHTDRPVLRINAHEKACFAIDWHPDGRHIVSGSADKNVRVWDFESSDRRPKPVLQFRAPQVVMNLRWRPPSWSSGSQPEGICQSTQLAIGYNKDDPRVHIWDLRRPAIPVRELDSFNSPATGLLWCSEDLLWTVGHEGTFTQTDVQYSPQPPDQISPCAIAWLGTGDHATFTENRPRRQSSRSEDPSFVFPGLSNDEISSGEQVVSSRSMTDDEAAGHESILHRRTQSTIDAYKSAKSLGNTPPSRDDALPIVSLRQALENIGPPPNQQVGMIGNTFGAAVDRETAKSLAQNYAKPMTESEKRTNPGSILGRLEDAFKDNGDACDRVLMYRLGQTWRILAAVILPELQAWADQNRRDRLRQLGPRSASLAVLVGNKERDKQSPRRDGKKTEEAIEGLGPLQTDKGDLLMGVARSDWQKLAGDAENVSNMTTPVARPTTINNVSTPEKSPQRFSNSDDAVESIPQLPPAVMAAHSTAAAASHVLKSDVDSPPIPSSIELGSSFTDGPDEERDSLSQLPVRRAKIQTPTLQNTSRSKSDWSSPGEYRGSDAQRSQQNRRQALREYRAQARPLLNFESSFDSPSSQMAAPIPMQRHDSTESLQMFPESSSSSHKAHLLPSSDSPEAGGFDRHASMASDDWDLRGARSFEQSLYSLSDEPGGHERHMLESSGRKDSSGLISERSASPLPEPFEFEPAFETFGRNRSRGLSAPPVPQPRSVPVMISERKKSPKPNALELSSQEYIYADFAPVDISTYYTNGHAKPWSALPLITQAIAFDLERGENHAQFSTHLLAHIGPFFFHRKYREKRLAANGNGDGDGDGQPAVGTLPERLLQPHLAHRIISTIFQQHHIFLKSLSLHIQAAELRKICVELDIPAVYRGRSSPDAEDEDPSQSSDNFFISVVCGNPECSAPMNLPPSVGGEAVSIPSSCARCGTPREPCPICLSIHVPLSTSLTPTTTTTTSQPRSQTGTTNLWTFCPACGHSAHIPCMTAWLLRPSTRGECPSPGCGHDCGPGAVRQARIQALAAPSTSGGGGTIEGEREREAGRERAKWGSSIAGSIGSVGTSRGSEASSSLSSVRLDSGEIRSSRGGATARSVKDSWKAPQSAAVERTRGLLRTSTSSVASGSESDRERDRDRDREAGGGAGSAGSAPAPPFAGSATRKTPSGAEMGSGTGPGAGAGAAGGRVGTSSPGLGAKKVVRVMVPGEERGESQS